MRLIDADEIVHYWGLVDGQGEWLIRKKDIDKMPTIKAIPIEWVKQKIAEKKDKFVGMCDDLTPIFVMYEQVLNDWERENVS